MKQKSIKLVIPLLLFVIFTIAVKVIDVRKIGPQNSFVGFAAINQWGHHFFGVHPLWDKLSDAFFLFAILVALYFVIKGAFQWLKRKRLLLVDQNILVLGIIYFIMSCCYLFFEKVVVNYRPILLEGLMEPSYPSSHILFGVTVLACGIIYFKRKIVTLIFSLVMIILVIGHLLSGVHWLSDIVGSLLLSFILIYTYQIFANVKNK
ncbi:phosphatase PAP2 family protein [Enterococcus sp. AZ103]|uniref:phosphatase PAP2 family protein n=1 Tax=Enterococcus sp. AZ103 TaxID=2774628 RepID=UPI003F23A446